MSISSDGNHNATSTSEPTYYVTLQKHINLLFLCSKTGLYKVFTRVYMVYSHFWLFYRLYDSKFFFLIKKLCIGKCNRVIILHPNREDLTTRENYFNEQEQRWQHETADKKTKWSEEMGAFF